MVATGSGGRVPKAPGDHRTMKIPYGVSNFGELRTENYFYVDKTPFLPQLEALGGRYFFFLRPRRFGK